jgi:hypothetical protein
LTLEDWDKNVGPRLQMIEAGAAIVVRNAAALAIRPGFETLAEDELHKAREALLDALDKIDSAQKVYHEKPLETA